MDRKSNPTALPDAPWFALVDVGLVAAAGAAWYNWPELGALPLLWALLPWAVRLFYGRFPFRRTPLDLPLLVFLGTALVGVWAAYDPERALAKFWMILAGVLLFYTLAGQPRANRWRIAWGMGGFAVALSMYFFLTHDFEVHPVKIDAFNRLGLALMGMRPVLPLRILHPNIVAGSMILGAPYLVAAGLREWRNGRRATALLPLAGLLLVLIALFVTTSRGAWLALAAALGLWLLWPLSGAAAGSNGRSQFGIFLVLIAGLVVAGLALVFTYPGGLIALINLLPGPEHAGSRVDLIRALGLLIADFPFTGGGLDAFAGLYAHYILVNPSYNLEHGHSTFLDITLEQGLFGGLAALAILLIAGWLLLDGIRTREGSGSMTGLLLWASLAGLVAMALHGMTDDALYGSRAQVLLWAAPGVGLSVLAGGKRKEDRPAVKLPDRTTWIAVGASVLVMIVYAWLFRGPLVVIWQANLAAVRMAQVELADFPTDAWDDGSDSEALQPSAAAFEAVLGLGPRNHTAHHRLGLIAMSFRDYERALVHLEAARMLSPNHPGILKSLAYTYVWSGRLGDALPLLQQVSEARFELGVYQTWWRGQGRDDLARNAASALGMLAPP